MRRSGSVAMLSCVCLLTNAELAFDYGQYHSVSPDIRAWFKGVTAPNDVPCCDMG